MASRRWVRAGKGQSSQRLMTDFQNRPQNRADGLSINVVWYKSSDLRLLDHEPLVRAHARAAPVLHVHLVELPLLAGLSRVGRVPRCSARRAAFWREAVTDLSQQLENQGQHLVVCSVTNAADFFKSLCQRFQVLTVFAHREFCDEEIKVEAEVRSVLSGHGAELETFWGGITLHHIDDLGIDPADSAQMPMYKGEFNALAKKRPIREVLPVPKLRSPPPYDAAEYGMDAIAAAFSSGPTVPPVDERQHFVWVGGETGALEYLQSYMDSGKLKHYRGATESFAHGDHNPVNAGTRLSPWLAFGCISARTIMHEAREFERKYGKSSSTGKGSGKMGSTGARLHTELNFRDFLRFSALSWGTKLFKVGGPFQVTGLDWSYDKERFPKWQSGETGYPFVDAGMRELATTGYMSHLHRQCCAAFLVRDLRLDWRMGAEHFESCLIDHTPDANWGNWAYRILQRPGLVESRRGYAVEEHITTVECIAWPAVHDANLEHTLRWVPELQALPRDLAREPWRIGSSPNKRIKVKPYKDSPLWFCAANRVNWDYEYFWLPGHAWTVHEVETKNRKSEFILGQDYPRPMVPPLNLEIDLDALPVCHSWGDTQAKERPHVWGTPGSQRESSMYETATPGHGKGKSKGKSATGKSARLRANAYERGYDKMNSNRNHRDFYSSQSRVVGA
jgi:deoxyribodipyrimidine photo-lyase